MYENRSMGILPMSSTGILPVAKTRDQHGLEGRALEFGRLRHSDRGALG